MNVVNQGQGRVEVVFISPGSLAQWTFSFDYSQGMFIYQATAPPLTHELRYNYETCEAFHTTAYESLTYKRTICGGFSELL